MTHHHKPYTKVRLDHPTGMDRRQQRRQKRKTGQYLTVLNSLGDTTIKTAAALRRQASASHTARRALSVMTSRGEV